MTWPIPCHRRPEKRPDIRQGVDLAGGHKQRVERVSRLRSRLQGRRPGPRWAVGRSFIRPVHRRPPGRSQTRLAPPQGTEGARLRRGLRQRRLPEAVGGFGNKGKESPGEAAVTESAFFVQVRAKGGFFQATCGRWERDLTW